MQNRITGSFGTTQVGGMLNFRKVNDEYGVSLIGEARFPKRERVICERIIELYEMGGLNFSFEIKYTEDHVVKEDGVMYIDVAEHNVLVGMAVVSVPAYQESYALSLTAEDHTEVGDSDQEANKGVEDMNEVEMITEEKAVAEAVVVNEAEITNTETAIVSAEENTSVEVVEAIAEEAVAEESAENENDEPEEEKPEEPVEEDEIEDEEEEEAVAEADTSVAQTEVDWAVERAQYLALEAEVANLRAQQVALEAEVERLRACEAELAAINAAKEAERMINEQNRARAFAEKQGLEITNEAVASAIESLDYKAIAELAMAQEISVAPAHDVTIASYASVKPMKINHRFENVLKRVSE